MMDIRRLRTVTILGPILFLVLVEVVGLVVLRPALGENSLLRLLVVFAVLTGAVVPFSFWVFATIERQQEALMQSHTELEQRVVELHEAHEVAAERNRQLDAVNTAIRSISSAIDLEHVLQNIADAARTLINCRYAALGVADQQGRIIRFITSGITPEQRVAIGPLPQGHGLLGVLIQEARPLRIADIGRHPQSHGFPPNHPPMTSLLGVPILFQGKPVGDLYLADRIGAPEFSQEDQDLLVLLANHAAVAIENARLYEDARAARDRLQAWSEQLEALVGERTREIERYSRETTTRVFQAQEDERKRIARELHDDTAQSLSSLLITLDLLEPSLPVDDAALRSGFDRIRSIGKRTLDEVRALSHDLRPTILDDFGLEAALQWYADECTATFGVPVNVDIDPGEHPPLAPEVELALFRIAQEALTNSGKYARASRVSLTLAFPDSQVFLAVEDNGRGFDLDYGRKSVQARASHARRPSRQRGLGLFGMRERAELLGADLAIESAPGKGTKVTVAVPLNPSVTAGNGAMAC